MGASGFVGSGSRTADSRPFLKLRLRAPPAEGRALTVNAAALGRGASVRQPGGLDAAAAGAGVVLAWVVVPWTRRAVRGWRRPCPVRNGRAAPFVLLSSANRDERSPQRPVRPRLQLERNRYRAWRSQA